MIDPGTVLTEASRTARRLRYCRPEEIDDCRQELIARIYERGLPETVAELRGWLVIVGRRMVERDGRLSRVYSERVEGPMIDAQTPEQWCAAHEVVQAKIDGLNRKRKKRLLDGIAAGVPAMLRESRQQTVRRRSKKQSHKLPLPKSLNVMAMQISLERVNRLAFQDGVSRLPFPLLVGMVIRVQRRQNVVEVALREDGYEWNGELYSSLSSAFYNAYDQYGRSPLHEIDFRFRKNVEIDTEEGTFRYCEA